MNSAELLARLAGCSIQATFLIGLVWLVCRMGWIKPRFRSLLWVAVFVHLLIGLGGGVELALLPAPTAPEVVVESQSPAPASTGLSTETLVAGLWILGVALSLIGVVWREVNARRALGQTSAIQADFADFVLEAAETAGVRNPLVKIVESDISPCVRGFFSPVVYVPKSLLNEPEESIRAVLIHEFAHIRHGDLRMSCLAVAAKVIFFFNPLVWFAYREWCVNREAACDEVVLERSQIKLLDYCNLLIQFAERSPALAATIHAASKSFSQLHRRICEMKTNQPKNRGAAPVATIAALLVSALAVIPISVTTSKSSSVEPLRVRKVQGHSSTDSAQVTVGKDATMKTFNYQGYEGVALRREDVEAIEVQGVKIGSSEGVVIVHPDKPDQIIRLDPKHIAEFVEDKDGFLVPKNGVAASGVIKVADLEKAAPRPADIVKGRVVKRAHAAPKAKEIAPIAAQRGKLIAPSLPAKGAVAPAGATAPKIAQGSLIAPVAPVEAVAAAAAMPAVIAPREAVSAAALPPKIVQSTVPLLPDLPLIPARAAEAVKPSSTDPIKRPRVLKDIPLLAPLFRTTPSSPAESDRVPEASGVQATRV